MSYEAVEVEPPGIDPASLLHVPLDLWMRNQVQSTSANRRMVSSVPPGAFSFRTPFDPHSPDDALICSTLTPIQSNNAAAAIYGFIRRDTARRLASKS
jgi:hypothetical protein